MSIIVQPYAVKIGEIKAVFNSKDISLFEAIKKTDLFDCYASQDEFTGTTEAALKAIIFGEPKQKKIAFAYGYALIAISGYLGKELVPEGDVFYFGDAYQQVNRYLEEQGVDASLDDMFEHNYEFEIPPIVDFPSIAGISKEKIQYLSSELDKITIDESKIDFDSEDFDEVQEKLFIFKRAVKECESEELEWITFAH